MKAGHVVKIPTARNLAHLLSKTLPFGRIQELCKLVGVEYDPDFQTLGFQCARTRCSRT